MKYIITESQLKLISELERDWRDFEYEEQYNKVKGKIIPYIVDQFDSYDDENNRIYISNSSPNILSCLIKNNTSSSSFVYYRIFEQDKCYTPASDIDLWFLYQPLLMNKSTFEGLSDKQQAALLAAAAKAEAFYLEQAKLQDAASVEVFKKAGVEIAEMTADDFAAWQALAQETSYAAFVADVPGGQELLDMALSAFGC